MPPKKAINLLRYWSKNKKKKSKSKKIKIRAEKFKKKIV
jgi:hypothetical protein